MEVKEMEYTKGEWVKYNRLYGTEVTEHIWCGDKHIADLDGEDATANAHLIASAPMLYEACKLALKYLRPLGKDKFSEAAEKTIETALSKAEGKV